MADALPAPDLALLQDWLVRCITHPSDVVQGAAGAAAALEMTHAIPDLIAPSATLNAGDRLAIYRNAYHLRLMEVLEAEYPALKLALGADLFGKFALLFLQRQPPSSYTLHDLSAGFPAFLAASVPQEDSAMGWPAFIIDLARLERTFQEVYRGPGTERRRTGGGVQQPPPMPATATATMAAPVSQRDGGQPAGLAPCLRLMACRYPVHEFLAAARRGEAAAWPGAHPTRLAICRRDYQVKIHALTPEEYGFLDAWQRSGQAPRPSSSQDDAAPAGPLPLARWAAEGFFI